MNNRDSRPTSETPWDPSNMFSGENFLQKDDVSKNKEHGNVESLKVLFWNENSPYYYYFEYSRDYLARRYQRANPDE